MQIIQCFSSLDLVGKTSASVNTQTVLGILVLRMVGSVLNSLASKTRSVVQGGEKEKEGGKEMKCLYFRQLFCTVKAELGRVQLNISRHMAATMSEGKKYVEHACEYVYQTKNWYLYIAGFNQNVFYILTLQNMCKTYFNIFYTRSTQNQ